MVNGKACNFFHKADSHFHSSNNIKFQVYFIKEEKLRQVIVLNWKFMIGKLGTAVERSHTVPKRRKNTGKIRYSRGKKPYIVPKRRKNTWKIRYNRGKKLYCAEKKEEYEEN